MCLQKLCPYFFTEATDYVTVFAIIIKARYTDEIVNPGHWLLRHIYSNLLLIASTESNSMNKREEISHKSLDTTARCRHTNVPVDTFEHAVGSFREMSPQSRSPQMQNRSS